MIWDGRIRADARQIPLADESVQCVVTSPPYWGLRDYGSEGQIGLEKTPAEYVEALQQVFREVWRVLEKDGTLWLNLGDSYAGSWGAQSRGNTTRESKATLEGASPLSARQIIAHPHLENGTGSLKRTPGLKSKDLVGIPWMVAFALRADGWYLRRDIIWHKPNPMPESVTDRPTSSHEYIFLLTKSERYFYDSDAIAEPAECGRLRGSGPMTKVGTGRNDATIRGDYRTRASVQRGGFNGKTEAMNGRNAFRAVTDMRNKRSVWTIATQAYPGAHYATFPEAIPEICIKAGTKPGDIVLDPFFGSGTVGLVAERLNRRWVGIDLGYQQLQAGRLSNVQKELLCF